MFYAITGRVRYCDNDATLIFEATNAQEAVTMFFEDMVSNEFASLEDYLHAESNGEGVFIYSIVKSETPITNSKENVSIEAVLSKLSPESWEHKPA